MNGHLCCIIGECCPPIAAEAALANALVEHVGCSEAEGAKHAAFMLASFDLAPKGTLGPLKKAMFEMGQKHRHETT